jgi:hypothetical protein
MISCQPPGVVVSSFVPVFTVMTVGSSPRTGQFVRLGKWIESVAHVTTAASFVMGTNPYLYSPVFVMFALASMAGTTSWCYDVSPATQLQGMTDGIFSAIVGAPVAGTSNITYMNNSFVTSTVPFTWATAGDQLQIEARYPAVA